MATIVRPDGRHSVLITGTTWITAVAIVGYKYVVGLAFTVKAVVRDSLSLEFEPSFFGAGQTGVVYRYSVGTAVSVRAKNLRRRTIADLNVESFSCRSAALNTYRHPLSSASWDFVPAIASSKAA